MKAGLRVGLSVVLLSAGFFASGCAHHRRASGEAPQLAALPTHAGPLARLEARVQERLGAERSGFHVLDANEDALRWRLALIDSARHSIDLQTFLWWGDEAGNLLLSRVLAAADRGVKVRLIIDDINTLSEHGADVKLRDVSNAAIDAHPNIEVRVFNPWTAREPVLRPAEMVGSMARLSQRMHNKALVADNHAVIVGGRNLGNEYLGLSDDFNFHDLDVVGVGHVARQVSAVFDRFWNSDWVAPAASLTLGVGLLDLDRERTRLHAALADRPALQRFPLPPQDWSGPLDALAAGLRAGQTRVYTDVPGEGGVELDHHLPAVIRALFESARHEVLVSNAYIIPGEGAVERTRLQVARGVRFRMLTNSLASGDFAGVNSHYKQWRERLLDAGVELHELRDDAAIRPQVADTPPTKAGFMGLHMKAIVIDRQRVFVGSMNLDWRSWKGNSELGLVIESPELAKDIAAIIERGMQPENAWRLRLDEQRQLRWVAGARELTEQPARSLAQRLGDLFFMLFPSDLF